MSDPNAISSNTAAYSYSQYQGQPQQAQSQTPQQSQAPQTPNSTANANRGGYPYTVNQYMYDPTSQLQTSQTAYGQYQAQPQSYSQGYQQPYQYHQPQQQQQQQQQQQLPQSTQTSTQANTQQPQHQHQQPQQQQQTQQPSDYSNAAYQNANRGYQSVYGSNPYAYSNTSYLQQPAQTQYMATSAANLNMANVRGHLQSGAQQAIVDPSQMPQRPKLTTTFWEDENTVCYQVESRGISVSRREDTNYINGTKLLNVAGMTRGRRDGILKSEKERYVVKIGAMNLKGVWIPFERALELATNEGIVDALYPLFVKDIKELYQGPQYSGGPTAAANNNKTIAPVTVTNTTYTPSSYGSAKDKKKAESIIPSSASEAGQSSQVPPSSASTQPSSAAVGAPYQYTAYQQYQQPGAPTAAAGGSSSTPAAGTAASATSGSGSAAAAPAYYGYGANPSTPQKAGDDKSTQSK